MLIRGLLNGSDQFLIFKMRSLANTVNEMLMVQKHHNKGEESYSGPSELISRPEDLDGGFVTDFP